MKDPLFAACDASSVARELVADLSVVECDGAGRCAVRLRLASPDRRLHHGAQSTIAETEQPYIVDSALIAPYGAVGRRRLRAAAPCLRTSGGIGDSEYGGELAIFHDKKIVAINTNSSSRSSRRTSRLRSR